MIVSVDKEQRLVGWLAARRGDVVAVAVIAVLAIGFFNPIFRLDATYSDIAGHQSVMYPWAAHPDGYSDAFPQSDQANAFYPWQVLINRTLDAGTIPLWNRYSFGGAPFLTNGYGGGLYYPPKAVLSLLFSPSWVHDLFMLLHVFLGGIAMYFLLRELGARFLGSMLAAVAWMFSAHTFGWIQLEYIGVIAFALPTSLLFVHRAFRLRSLASAYAAGLVLGVSSWVTVFIPVLLFPVVLASTAVLGVREIIRGRRIRDRPTTRFGLLAPATVVLSTVGSAALILMPTVIAAASAGRKPFAYADLVRNWDVPVRAFERVFYASSAPISVELLHELVFVGTPAALLAVFAVVARPRGALFGIVLALVTFLVTVGTPATWVAYELLPGFDQFRPLGRALFLWAFAVAILGGLGLDVLQRWAQQSSAIPDLSIRGDAAQPQARARMLPILAALVGVGAIAWTAMQLIPYDRKINPPFQPRDSAFLYPRTAAVQALDRARTAEPRTEELRLLPLTRDYGDVPWRPPVLEGGVPTVLGLESTSGYESILPARIVALNRVVGGETPDQALDVPLRGGYLPSFFAARTRFDLLPRLGVTTVYAPPDIHLDPSWRPATLPFRLRGIFAGTEGQIFQIAGVHPRAYVVYRASRAEDDRAALRRFANADFDYRHAVILEGDDASPAAASSRCSGDGPSARIAAIGANSESYDVTSACPGWLVVSSMWDPGWGASVNGKGADVLRADYNLRAVGIPAGRSHVELTYRPPGLVAGAGLTTLTLLVPPFLLGFRRLRRRRSPASAGS